MLPDSDGSPSYLQLLIDQPIAFFITGKLFSPKLAVGLRERAVAGTTVPKTSVDEYGEATGGENEVWFSENPQLSSPTNYAIFSERVNTGTNSPHTSDGSICTSEMLPAFARPSRRPAGALTLILRLNVCG
jgi:hypothetical protein